jgi:hypothetical protein
MSDQTTLQKIASVVQGVAPMIAGVLGGPQAGQLTSLGLSTLAKFLGITDPNPSPETVLQAAQIAVADPAQKLILVQAENDFTLKMKGLEIDELKAGLANIENARDRQNVHEKETGKTDVNLYVLAWVIIGGFLALTGFLLYFSYMGKSIVDQTGVLFMLLGTLSTSFGMVVGYFFGSSMGSADKSKAMERTSVALADVAAKGKK